MVLEKGQAVGVPGKMEKTNIFAKREESEAELEGGRVSWSCDGTLG